MAVADVEWSSGDAQVTPVGGTAIRDAETAAAVAPRRQEAPAPAPVSAQFGLTTAANLADDVASR